MMEHGSIRASLFRPSQRFNASIDNPFFVALENEINAAFVDDSLKLELNIQESYICNRPSEFDNDTIDAMASRLPDDILSFLRQFTPGHHLLPAYYELDFLNFLLNSKSNKVLAIVGSVGSGKSTYLSFIFRRMVKECPSLNDFLPVIVDGLLIGDDDFRHYELCRRLHEDCKFYTQLHIKKPQAFEICNGLDQYFAKKHRSD
ncbi:hypothetical protein [Marinibactrum halimedae]|uniref:Uncharacterized protein n=1 Tax=Marinibactrum halimedae TaxID=1444977 RepID=A0AA37T465_9GAMM|nr:hypothetical protein [Marinibactrum halimedae]MCD9459102.1 hypothetical protein [Marinibactrum halimedae]GLS24703.1 hypothetical protein GCM10007877_04170 [Marinibactrum halimedae]